jgi:hypothetical protein
MDAKEMFVSFSKSSELARVRLSIPVVPRGTEESVDLRLWGRIIGTAEEEEEEEIKAEDLREDLAAELEEELRTDEVAVKLVAAELVAAKLVAAELVAAELVTAELVTAELVADEAEKWAEEEEEEVEGKEDRPPLPISPPNRPVEEAAVCPMVEASTPSKTIGIDGYGRRSGPRNISRNSIHSLIS